MDLVIDANILFAALIKNSTTARLVVHGEIRLFAPKFLFDEFRKYEPEILAKLHRPHEEYQQFLSILKRRINLLSQIEYETFLDESKQISPDIKDIAYFAVAMKNEIPFWSND